MKKVTWITVFIPSIIIGGLIGCSSANQEAGSELRSDSMQAANAVADPNTLESLLGMKNEEELIKRFGQDKVKYDTVWGAEGFFSMGTIVKTEAASHLEITWMNDSLKTEVVSVTQVSDSDWYADTLLSSTWKSATGVHVGMSINELQKINGRVFTFSGFGWDYAGGVISWQGGTMEGKGVAVQLSEGPINQSKNVTTEQRNAVLGDVEVQSDNPVLVEYSPRVWSISVAKLQ